MTAAASEMILSQLRKGVVELAILTPLQNAGAFRAEIVDRVGEYPGLAITAGTAYPLLSRLKKAGLINSAYQEFPCWPAPQVLPAVGRG